MVKNSIVYLLCTIVYTNYAIADVKEIDQGSPAPFSGYLFDKTSEQQARQAVEDAAYYKDLSFRKDRIINEYKANDDLYTQRLNNYSTQNDKLAQELQGSHTTSDLVKIGYFTVGFGLAVGAAYIVSKVK